MYRPLAGAQSLLRVAIPTLILAVGCAQIPSDASAQPAARAPVGRHLTLEARPSAAAAELLPAGARYRAVLGVDKQLALVIVGADGRILGRLEVCPEQPAPASVGARVDYEDIGGSLARIEAWSLAGSIDGEAVVGERSASFRVRLGHDGSLAAERWSLAHGERSAELDELRRARAIAADLAAITGQLARAGAFAEIEHRSLAELLALAELALELSVRAWAGEDRARLPAVQDFVHAGL